MATSDWLYIIGLLLTVLIIGGGAVAKVRADARESTRLAHDKAEKAMSKAHEVEVTFTRDYVSHTALKTITDGVLREIDRGFKHINVLLAVLGKKEEK